MEKNRLENVRKHVFYKHMNIVTKNGWRKREKIFFSETHRFRKQTTMEKYRLEKVRKHVFFINTRISWPKNGAKKREKKLIQKHT